MHESRPDIEIYANQSKWLENMLLDVEKKIDTSSFLQVPTLQEKNGY